MECKLDKIEQVRDGDGEGLKTRFRGVVVLSPRTVGSVFAVTTGPLEKHWNNRPSRHFSFQADSDH